MKIKVKEIDISYQGNHGIIETPPITSSSDAAAILLENWPKGKIGVQESFRIMLLNNGNRVMGIYEVSSGGITATLVDIRILFAVVLKSLSTAIILAHNHPSGNLHPSEEDKKLTIKIIQAAELLDIKVLDHIILTLDGEYFSFSDEDII